MGWEVHMTRADHWPDSDQRPITADEWLAVVAADPELRIDAANGSYFAVWSGLVSYPDGGWFDWADGCVSTKHPDRAILGKLLQLAGRLGAVVQGRRRGVLAATGFAARRPVRGPAPALVAILVRPDADECCT